MVSHWLVSTYLFCGRMEAFSIRKMTRQLTIVKKKQVLDSMAEVGATQVSVARKMGISAKTVRNILNRKKEITELSVSSVTAKKFHVRVDQKYERINRAVLMWLQEMREKRGEIPIVEGAVRQKASEFASKFGVTDFKASSGWFRSWKARSRIESYKVAVKLVLMFFYRCAVRDMTYPWRMLKNFEDTFRY